MGGDPVAAPPSGRHHVEHVMGTAVSIDIRDHGDLKGGGGPTTCSAARAADVAAGVDAVVQWLHHVDRTFSTYRLDSPISRFGTGAAGLDEMSEEVLGILALCDQLHDETEGAFDAFAVPAPNGSRLDPSGVVKGWAVERAAAILETHGCTDFCLNAGGDVVLRGSPRPGAAWHVGVRHPARADRSATVIAASGRLSIATSATYERGAHIIDPSTGEPTADLASVTVVGPSLTRVDAYATAIFVMGERGPGWLARCHPDHAAFVITHDERTISTANFVEYRLRSDGTAAHAG